jgi:hypothetical protein
MKKCEIMKRGFVYGVVNVSIEKIESEKKLGNLDYIDNEIRSFINKTIK